MTSNPDEILTAAEVAAQRILLLPLITL
jgi:hypothetical protein